MLSECSARNGLLGRRYSTRVGPVAFLNGQPTKVLGSQRTGSFRGHPLIPVFGRSG